ncbi:MAG: aminotransferase class I/II-fold pyridoxal phosphate-dependent enzyme [Planctomycetaceae bacterium]
MPVIPRRTQFADTLAPEAAFVVLARARQLKAEGRDIVELEIGDSPFDTTAQARQTGIQAIQQNATHYCPSPGLPDVREAAADFVKSEFGIPATMANVAIGPGAKIFQQFFCELFLDTGDGALVFSPYFPTYAPNIARRGARMVLQPLRQEHHFRPQMADIERFLKADPSPRAIFLNSPHNPTGGVMTKQDLRDLADLLKGTEVAVFSDEPYCHMVWQGQHHSPAAEVGMLDRCMAAYTFSKSYSMSGWRLGFCVSSPDIIHATGLMINTTLSCTPPLVQLAGKAALQHDSIERQQVMQKFNAKVELLTEGLNRIDGFHALPPAATFYVFANVEELCGRLGITSHGLALYLLEGADDDFGIACLGGECFGEAGAGFLRFSCAEPDERLRQAIDFIPERLERSERIAAWRESHPDLRL